MDREQHVSRGGVLHSPAWRRSLAAALTVVGVWAVAGRLQAQLLYAWNNPSGGNYASAVNWFPGGGAPPDAIDAAEFSLASTYTVNFFSNFAVSEADVFSGDVTWDLGTSIVDKFTYTVNSVRVGGFGGTPRLTVRDGLLYADTVLVSDGGRLAAATVAPIDAANLTVTDAGSLYSGTSFVAVANDSAFLRPATMTVSNSGAVSHSNNAAIGDDLTSGSPATVTVTGAGSTWSANGSNFFVGNLSPGTLNITAGGVVAVTAGLGNSGHSTVGSEAAGTATVDGPGSAWTTTGDFFVAANATGTLSITGGGMISNSDGWIGNNNGSGSVTVSGAGSRWNNSGELTVAFNSSTTGTLTIANGGAVSDTNGIIGEFGEFSTFPAADGVVTVTGAGSSWTNSGSLIVAVGGTGTLNIQNGGAVSNVGGWIGSEMGGEGAVNVTGAGSQWNNSGNLTVGLVGDGELLIQNGGDVSNAVGSIGAAPGGVGAVTVTGTGSTWTNTGANFSMGGQGTGMLTIEAGGSVTTKHSQIGGTSFANPGVGVANVVVRGPGSNWTSSDNNNILIGHNGTGTLLIENGGSVSDANGFLGFFGGSTGTVTVRGAGSTWTNADSLNIGQGGTGTLTIEQGASVTNTDGHIAPAVAASTGTVLVQGAGSTWNMSAELFVGTAGTGSLTIANGGSVSSLGARIAFFGTGNGAITVGGAGSSLSIAQRLSVGGDATTGANGGTGTLNINPGGTVNVGQDVVLFAGDIVRLQGGTLTTAAVSFQGGGQFQMLSGTLHVGTFNGSLTNQGGTLAPGQSAGNTTIIGNYTQQAGAQLEIEIGGLSAGGQYDLVGVTGNAILGGQLQLSLDSFMPAAGNTFTVLQAAGGIFGVFNNVSTGQRLATADGLGSFLVHYGAGSAFNSNQIVLNGFEPSLTADFDGDGDVDAADLNQWQGDFGANALSDADNDGDSDGNDFLVWQRQFGNSPGVAPAAAIPEPGALALASLAVCGLASRRRRER